MIQKSTDRFWPKRPNLGTLGSVIALKLAERFLRNKQIFRSTGPLAVEKRKALTAMLARGETAYLAGISMGGFHNSGVALVELTRDGGPRVICNNEEERFSGRKHATHCPDAALAALAEMMAELGVAPQRVVAWLGTFDYPLLIASLIRWMLEEAPAGFNLARASNPGVDRNHFLESFGTALRLGRAFGEKSGVPIICIPHHDNHAYFSYLVSPFSRDSQSTLIAVVDGAGDQAAISVYLGENGFVRPIWNNGTLIDSLGIFYGVISATQGGWTPLSSEGRYMGASAFGDMTRATNRYYADLRNIFRLDPDGAVRLNRSLANWHSGNLLHKPYAPRLAEILGPPLAPEHMWNPDAVLRVEDIHHRPETQDRLDKAAATQMVFEDALTHVIDHFIRSTGTSRLVLTGGTALNAVANMGLLETFDEAYYDRMLGKTARLHLWVPPVPGDAGVTLGAPYAFAASAGVGPGPALQHAFYCGRPAKLAEILSALRGAVDLEWIETGTAGEPRGIEAVADLMAFITARDGIIGIVQGAAETGPRALGHRSILANACNPRTRDTINERVKYREPIRPLAPMATLKAAQDLFWLSEGASDDNYNAYNYMVITVRAKAHARQQVPAIIHVDGTARIQIVREETDPVAYAYLRALGRRTGIEVAVNTSFNVAAPIAQTPAQVIETLRRAKNMDGIFVFAAEGPVFMAWLKQPQTGVSGRLQGWLRDWQHETGR